MVGGSSVPEHHRSVQPLYASPCVPQTLLHTETLSWAAASIPAVEVQLPRGANLLPAEGLPCMAPLLITPPTHPLNIYRQNPQHITRKGSALPFRLVNSLAVAHNSDTDILMWHCHAPSYV